MGSTWAAEQTLPKNLDAFIAEGLKDWQSPGLAVAVVKDGQPVLLQGYGVWEIAYVQP